MIAGVIVVLVKSVKPKKFQKVSDVIMQNFPTMSYGVVQKLLRAKDIKVNGKRISDDVKVSENDEVLFYINEIPSQDVEIIYEDEDIVVVFKDRKLETVSENNNDDLLSRVSFKLNLKCFAVHRLDRNTQGLVVFAKNIEAKNSLDLAFRNRTIEKFYLTEVYGFFEKKEDELVAYLKKIPNEARVLISDDRKDGYVKIQTNYKVLKELDATSIVEVELVTGKTHQIRAHLAHVGHFVIGDEKYGNSQINRYEKKKFQNLCSYKIKFHFNHGDYLYRLDNFLIEFSKNKIDFCQNL